MRQRNCRPPAARPDTSQYALMSCFLQGAYLTAQAILQHDGVRGLYKGYGTVVAGAIPARILYLSTLEAMKAATRWVREARNVFALVHTCGLGSGVLVCVWWWCGRVSGWGCSGCWHHRALHNLDCLRYRPPTHTFILLLLDPSGVTAIHCCSTSCALSESTHCAASLLSLCTPPHHTQTLTRPRPCSS